MSITGSSLLLLQSKCMGIFSASGMRHITTLTFPPGCHARSTNVRVDVPVLSPLLPLAPATPPVKEQGETIAGQVSLQQQQHQQQHDLLMGCELFSAHDKAAAARLEQLSSKKAKVGRWALGACHRLGTQVSALV
jgi:hypothetical protein